MIAELPGGKEIEFPDSMEEECVDRICALLVEAMQAAEDAKAEAKTLRERLDKLATSKPAASNPASNADVVRAIGDMKAVMERSFQRLERIAKADTKIVFDATGEPVRGRKVLDE